MLASVLAGGCYRGARATADVNAAWQGHSRADIEEQWGAPDAARNDTGELVLAWTHTRRRVDLPSADAEVSELSLAPLRFEGRLAIRRGAVWESSTTAIARVDPDGRIAEVQGPSLRWGPPDDANLRWGTVLGLHAGMGRLDDTSTPLPSGGLYIGGMLSRTLALVGTFALAAGRDDGGGALGLAAGLGAQWWAGSRWWVRAGPALVLDFDPGFQDAALAPGLSVGSSYALLDHGHFVLDLRLDLVAGPSVAFGSVGVGVNLD